VWVRDPLRKGGSMPVVGHFPHLRLCPVATRGEWIFTRAPFLRPARPRLPERLGYRGVETAGNPRSRTSPGERLMRRV
jgi:hypothetical protein